MQSIERTNEQTPKEGGERQLQGKQQNPPQWLDHFCMRVAMFVILIYISLLFSSIWPLEQASLFDTVPPMYRHSRRNMHHRVLLMIKRRRRRKNSRHRDFFTLNERAAERSTNSTFSLSSCCPDELTLLLVVAKTFRVLLGTCEKVTAGFLCELHPSLKRKSPFPVRFFTRYLTQVWKRKRKKFLNIFAKMPFV